MRILDATAGCRGIWYQKNHPDVTFLDKRKGVFGKNIKYNINPDVVCEWKDMPFPDNTFDMVIFDPPHIIQNAESGDMVAEYGKLGTKTWKDELKVGFNQCFRVLKEDGIFILKWAECIESKGKKINELLEMIEYNPLVGTRVGYRSTTLWIIFKKDKISLKSCTCRWCVI